MTEHPPSQNQVSAPATSEQKGAISFKGKRRPFSATLIWQIVGIMAVTGMVGLIAITFLPLPIAGVAVLVAFFITLWATAVVPEYWTALAFFLVAMVFAIAPAQTVFSGFHTSTFWLLFSGLVLGAAIRHTGLGQRAAALLARRLGSRYVSVIFGLVLFSLALAFVMPSSVGRIVLLIPIVLALAEHMGYSNDSNGRTGMLIATAFGTFLPAFTILPSNVPNMMLAGMAETLYGSRLTYWEYLLLHFPVLGALKAMLLVWLVLWMFPDADPAHEATADQTASPMTVEERRLAVVLGLCLVFWLTDAFHHISPGWIGLAAALYCLWPGVNLTAKKCLSQDINYGILFFVAGIMGLGAVISNTGLGEAVVHGLTAHAGFSADHPVWNVAVLTGISTLVAIVTNLPGVPAVMTPVAQDLANLTGLSLAAVLMTQVLAFSNVFLPYQAPPLIAAMQVGHLSVGTVARVCLVLFAITALILTPLDLLWWYLLGVFS